MKTKNKLHFFRVLCLVITAFLLTYLFLLSPIDQQVESSLFEVKSGSTIENIAVDLKEQGLIKSVLAFKLNARLHHTNNFKSGTYVLYRTMSLENISLKIQSGDVVYPEQVKVTFPEGLNIVEMAEILSNHIDYSQEEIINAWDDPKFLNEIISSSIYLTKDMTATGISHPLNGYLFPETYFLMNKNITPQEVARIMLAKMEKTLNKYSDLIEEQNLSLHEVLTLASIIEYEAKNDKDRPIISGVFHNRLQKNMKLESCATLEIALGVHKKIYSRKDSQINSPYNTYLNPGLPIGPINCPSAKSIEAALKPTKHNYYYFLSDIYGDNKTYYAKTLAKHNQLKKKYLR